jgi:hypothetical protein
MGQRELLDDWPILKRDHCGLTFLKVFASNHFENYLFATLKAVDSLFRQFR